MDKHELMQMSQEFVEMSVENIIAKEVAISEAIIGTKIYEPPIFAFGAADDEKFRILKDESVIGKHFMLPREWLPQARTVISFFLPFTEAVRNSNRKDMSWPSDEWLHGRIQGQEFLKKLCLHIESRLVDAGYPSIAPSFDKRFWVKLGLNNISTYPDNFAETGQFTSNWSERHVAFVCGLGTFGLSKGLITKKGIAGRFGSVVTTLPLSPDKRTYENIYEYCSMCGACARNCPAHAISEKEGKDHKLCAQFLDEVAENCKESIGSYVGCGKCQVGVPCENCIPEVKV